MSDFWKEIEMYYCNQGISVNQFFGDNSTEVGRDLMLFDFAERMLRILPEKDAEIEQLQCWRGMYDVILRREQQLEQKLAVAMLTLEFYADGSNWQSYNLDDFIPMRHDREDVYSVAGMKARQALAQLKEQGEIK